MANSPNNTSPDTNLTPPSGQRPIRRSRPLILLSGLLFSLSLMFPIIASLTPPEHLSIWIGGLDVILAIGLTLLMLTIYGLAHTQVGLEAQQASYRFYRILANFLLVLLGAYFVFGEDVRWEILLPGLAWRLWLLIYVFPAAFAAWKFADG